MSNSCSGKVRQRPKHPDTCGKDHPVPRPIWDKTLGLSDAVGERQNRQDGYSPACENEWRLGICHKPKVKCAECPHQRFPPLDERAVESHLRGEQTLGVYAIGTDDTCRFLAPDLDGEGWRDDVMAYREAAERVGITIAIERSRSGNGAHAWIFFAEPVADAVARRLGTILVAKASALRPSLGLGAYDRLFPNQDTLPAGGFGNLIALPLAKIPRQSGNTLFVDSHLKALPDQWSYLAGLPRLSRESVERTLARIAPMAPRPASAPFGAAVEHNCDFALQNDAMVLDLSQPRIRRGLISGEVTVRLDAQIHVPRSLPTPVLAALRRLATFPNPVFHEKLRLRFPTFDTPRFLFAGEWQADRLVLPRGVLDKSLSLLETAGASVVVQDARESGTRVPWKFQGALREGQEAAVRTMLVLLCYIQSRQHDVSGGKGRVEEWRGGGEAAPVPLPAHQTGRADFPHPAFGPRSVHAFAHGRLAVVFVRRMRPSVS